jgi:sulfur-oxidizing protein SoxX
MKNMNNNKLARTAALASMATLGLLSACASYSPEALDAQANTTMLASFRSEGIAKAERIRQDAAQAACSADKPPTAAVAERIMAEAKASVKWPSGGQYIGDWREGERIAQNGRGFTWTDESGAPGAGGGSCYNCHQIGRAEISFGTIGPSLWNYGKNRGVRDVTAPTAQPVLEYTWMKIWNSKSFAACSDMPRFGHAGLMTEAQIRHVMALLLDPKSPVNE